MKNTLNHRCVFQVILEISPPQLQGVLGKKSAKTKMTYPVNASSNRREIHNPNFLLFKTSRIAAAASSIGTAKMSIRVTPPRNGC